jgi:predicted acetyltransferase
VFQPVIVLKVTLVQVLQPKDRETIASLVGAYLRELGLAEPYPYFDLYWQEAGRFPFLLSVSEAVAGFALVRRAEGQREFELAEFYVSPPLRRRGLGRTAAQALFAQLGGAWRVRAEATNGAACAFWRSVLAHAPVAPEQHGAYLTWNVLASTVFHAC